MKETSKDMLADSFIELTASTNPNKITVKKLVEFCGVGRQTFYNHFDDIYSLISYILHRDLVKLIAIYEGTDDWYACAMGVYDFFRNNRIFYTRLMHTKYLSGFMESLRQLTKNHFINSIRRKYGEKELPKSIVDAIDYHCYGITSMNIKWINGGMKESSKEMTDFSTSVLPSILRKFLIYEDTFSEKNQ